MGIDDVPSPSSDNSAIAAAYLNWFRKYWDGADTEPFSDPAFDYKGGLYKIWQNDVNDSSSDQEYTRDFELGIELWSGDPDSNSSSFVDDNGSKKSVGFSVPPREPGIVSVIDSETSGSGAEFTIISTQMQASPKLGVLFDTVSGPSDYEVALGLITGDNSTDSINEFDTDLAWPPTRTGTSVSMDNFYPLSTEGDNLTNDGSTDPITSVSNVYTMGDFRLSSRENELCFAVVVIYNSNNSNSDEYAPVSYNSYRTPFGDDGGGGGPGQPIQK